MRRSAKVLASFIFLISLSTLANACMLNGQHYRLASDTVRWSLELNSGESCIRGVRFNNVVVDKLILVSAPQSGHVTLDGPGFSYKAASDFHGQDFFSVRVFGTTNKIPGSSTIEVVVSVSRPGELGQSPIIPPSSRAQLAPSPSSSATPSPPPLAFNELCGSSNGAAVSSAPTTNLCIQVPGPSLTLFNLPYYTCLTNRYVSTTGSDRNDGTAPDNAHAWATLQKANTANVGAGGCINVLPGTYPGVQITHGGNAATSSGYVIYRCTAMDACTIKGNAGPNGNSGFFMGYSCVGGCHNDANVNYIIIDGFTIAWTTGTGWGQYGQGIAAGAQHAVVAGPHHIWVLNNIISDFNQSGVSVGGGGDYFYVMHNKIYNNSGGTCEPSQGSGVSVLGAWYVSGYTPTNDDKNPYAGFGFPTFNLGDGTHFHTVVAFNWIYNNNAHSCAGNMDANGIIFDTDSGPGGNPWGDFHEPMLAYGNVVYNNSGGGVHVFTSYNIWSVNNSVFNNGIDPNHASGTGGAGTDDNGAGSAKYPNHYYNNIAVACTSSAPSHGTNNNAISLSPSGDYDLATNNITYMVNNYSYCGGEVATAHGQTYSTAANKEGTNPRWVNVSFKSPGTTTTPPANANFALAAGSPAIGYGTVTLGAWMPAQSADAGACYHTLTTCP